MNLIELTIVGFFENCSSGIPMNTLKYVQGIKKRKKRKETLVPNWRIRQSFSQYGKMIKKRESSLLGKNNS